MKEKSISISLLAGALHERKGQTIKIKVNRGRNKIELIEGILENAYPNIFTVRKVSGEINSFSYADIISKTILFIK